MVRKYGKDRIHDYVNNFCGFNVPRWWVRKLTARRLLVLRNFASNQLALASDNDVPRYPRPKWLPKDYIYAKRK